MSLNKPDSEERFTRLYLVRHGELLTSSEWRYVGQMNIDMNETGINQIKKLARRLSKEGIEKIFSSDLKRTIDSANIIGAALGLENVPLSDFREIDLGVWEGLTLDEITEKFTDDFNKRSKDIGNFRVTNGESFSDMQKRVLPKIKECISSNFGEKILLVAHGGVNRIILADALGMNINNIVNFDQNYACLNIIDYYKTGPVVKLLNENVI